MMKNNVVLIKGASSGIGKDAAHRLNKLKQIVFMKGATIFGFPVGNKSN